MAIKLKVSDAGAVKLRTPQDEPLRLGAGLASVPVSYVDLTDKPQINGVELEGNKTSEDLGVQGVDKLVQTITAASTEDEYPSARAVWNSAAKYAKAKRFTGYSVPGFYFYLNNGINLADIYNAQTSGNQVVYLFDTTSRITYRVTYCYLEETHPQHIVVYATAQHVDTAGAPGYQMTAKFADALYAKGAATSTYLMPYTYEPAAKTDIPTAVSQLTNDAGYITGGQVPSNETDPTVPSWAKAPSKPSYTAAEVGALPDTTVIPTAVSQLNNDSGFVDAAGASAAAPVQSVNGQTGAVTGLQAALTFDNTPTEDSTNPVKSGGVYDALALKQDAGNYAAAKAGDTTKTALATASIPYAQVDATSTSTAFTATVPGITEYRDGVSFWLRNGVVTSAAGFTVNINGLGALKSFSNMAPTTQDTTLFNVNYTMMFVYCSWLDSGHGAFLMYRGYDANTNTLGYQVRTNSTHLPMSSTMYRYRLMFTSADGTHWVPANNSTSTNATAARTPCQDPIDPFGMIYYYSATAAINQGAKPAAASCWQQYTLTLGYSFNWTGAALTLTIDAPTYLVCNPQADGSAKIDSTAPIVQALPTTDDGKIYIFLGIAYSATQIELQFNHPVYYYKNGAIRRWVGPV